MNDEMKEVPIWEKVTLTIEEAAAYSNIGINKLRELADETQCDFVLKIGNKKLIKRHRFEQFLENSYYL